MKNGRIIEAKKFIGKKVVKGKLYEYEYYTLPLNLYLSKYMVRLHGTRYVINVDEDKGIITISAIKEGEQK